MLEVQQNELEAGSTVFLFWWPFRAKNGAIPNNCEAQAWWRNGCRDLLNSLITANSFKVLWVATDILTVAMELSWSNLKA